MFPLLTLRPETLFKKRLWHRYFPVNFAKILKTPFFIEHLRWLLLYLSKKLKKTLSVQDSSNVTMTSQYQIGVRILHASPQKPQENAITKLDKSEGRSSRLQVCKACRPATLLKKDSNTGVFLWIFRNFWRTAFSIEHLWWLLLLIPPREIKSLSKSFFLSNLFYLNI